MSRFHLNCCVLALLVSLSGAQAQMKTPAPTPDTYNKVRQLFQNPPSEFRSAPLWVWNDQISRGEIDEQLTNFKARGIGGVFIHPRPGLITEYLSDEWFALCRHAVDKGKKLGMKIWIYDENSYPSGFAGGHVPAQMPDAVRKGLSMNHVTRLPSTWTAEPYLVLQKSGSAFIDISKDLKSKIFGAGDYYIFTVVSQAPNPWYGGFTYVDVMRREVTEKFIDVTMNAYKRSLGKEFGKTVPGVFQDEAEISPAGVPGMPSVNYTPALFEAFESKWKYDLRLNLPSLYEDVGDWRRVRHNFYSTILNLFINGWAKPYFDYCTKNNLAFTGHYWEHEWPRPVVNPDNLAFAAYSHMPGIDILMNEFRMDTHAQFGNARAVREIRSSANQTGMLRTMSETFGAGGWDMTFFDQKRIADWEYVLGVNFINQHLSYMTIKGARKTDHPLSFSYHEPWWSNYNVLADYYGRLSVATSLGAQQNSILVIEPTTTAWMHYAAKGGRGRFEDIEKGFQGFVNSLEAAQIEYDLGSEQTIRELANVVKDRFILGKRAYNLVILPPTLENLDHTTFKLLDEFLNSGGKVLCYGNPPAFLDGVQSDLIAKSARSHPENWTTVLDAGDCSSIERLSPLGISFNVTAPTDPSQQLLFHHRRTFKDFELVLLVNTSDKTPVAGSITLQGRSCEEWDAFGGATKPYPFQVEKGTVKVEFSIPRAGSLLLCFRPTDAKSPGRATTERTTILALSGSEIRRLAKNVLTLDYCDLTLNGKTGKDLYFYDAQTKVFQAHGLSVNPWDHAVQYKKNIVEKNTFGKQTGFEASFSFSVQSGTRLEGLNAVIERPELYQVSINGVRIEPVKNKWWLDKAFGVFNIEMNVIEGENQIVLKSSPFTIHTELQPVFILGDFALEVREKGFAIAPAVQMKLGSWVQQGMPFYAEKVGYSRKIRVSDNDLSGSKIMIRLGIWTGVVAEVEVNGKKAGVIAFDPFELDVTKHLKPGINDVSVIVCGSLKNTLGPHHNDPQLGRAWPGAFQQGAKDGHPAGSRYSVVGYGLMEDFKVEAQRE
ncbi:MAG: glycosyl hydrolase [Ignavibacteriales bacterium]|nr:glycosyl hydrolase [Ignavibacteriales bacterium]